MMTSSMTTDDMLLLMTTVLLMMSPWSRIGWMEYSLYKVLLYEETTQSYRQSRVVMGSHGACALRD
jgi:hypothetical protein